MIKLNQVLGGNNNSSQHSQIDNDTISGIQFRSNNQIARMYRFVLDVKIYIETLGRQHRHIKNIN